MKKGNYNLGIVGSRHYDNYPEFSSVIKNLLSIYGIPTKVVSGGHTDKYGKIKLGTDTLAWKWAVENKIPIIEHNAEWDKYGRAAGPIRNQLIINDTDVLIAFIGPNSVGTKHSISLAKKDPIIKIYTYDVIN